MCWTNLGGKIWKQTGVELKLCKECIHSRGDKCSQGYENEEDCPFEDWRDTYKGDKMIVAFTKIGPSSDVLIREVKGEQNEYRVEVRRNLKVEHETPAFTGYEDAEKFYESLLSEVE